MNYCTLSMLVFKIIGILDYKYNYYFISWGKGVNISSIFYNRDKDVMLIKKKN